MASRTSVYQSVSRRRMAANRAADGSLRLGREAGIERGAARSTRSLSLVASHGVVAVCLTLFGAEAPPFRAGVSAALLFYGRLSVCSGTPARRGQRFNSTFPPNIGGVPGRKRCQGKMFAVHIR